MAPKAEQKKGDEGERVPLSALDPQQLLRLRQDIEMDVQRLSEYGTNMQKIKQTLASAKNSVETLAQSSSGQPILLPLTSSLYVNGEVDASDSVLVDIGTGYYVEMTCDDAVKYHERKIGKLDGSMNTIMQSLQQKQAQLLEINAVLNDKMQAAQAAQAAQVASKG